LHTIPTVIDAFAGLGFAFGVGFLASSLRQYVQIARGEEQ